MSIFILLYICAGLRVCVCQFYKCTARSKKFIFEESY